MKRINLRGIGGMLGRNAEKIGVGILGAIALWLAFQGINALRSKSVTPDHQPEAIATLARQAATTVETADAPPAERLPPLKPIGPLLDPWRPQQVKIAPSTVADAPLARPLVLAAGTKRETPTVFPIEQLQARSGVAVLESIDDPAGAGRPMDRGEAGIFGFGAGASAGGPLTRGVITPYVLVTGLIPAGKQQAEFVRCLGDSLGAGLTAGGGGFAGGREGDVSRDRPVWTGFRIERQERDPARGGDFGEWKRLEPPAAVADPGAGRGEFGGGGGRDLLPMDFRLQEQERSGMEFESPLPPRVVEDRPWGTETVHPWFFQQIVEKRLASGPPAVALDDLRKSPEEWLGKTVKIENVSLAGIGERDAYMPLFRYRLTGDDPADEEAEIGTTTKLVFVVSDRWGRSMLSGEPPSGDGHSLLVRIDPIAETPVARILEIVKGDTVERDPDPMSSAEGGMSFGFEQGRLDEGMGPGRMGREMMGGMEGAEYRSFRFLDRSIEPGKEYRYRVNVSINNPNEGLTPRQVVDAKTLKIPILTSDYSAESGAVRAAGTSLAGVLARSMSDFEYRSRRTLDNKLLPPLKRGVLEVLLLSGDQAAGNLVLRKAEAKPGESIRYEKPTVDEEPAAARGSAKQRPKKPELIPAGAVLLDFRGEQLTKNEDPSQMTLPPEPLEALVLFPDGRIEHVTAIDSAGPIRSHEASLGEIPPDGQMGGRFEGR